MKNYKLCNLETKISCANFCTQIQSPTHTVRIYAKFVERLYYYIIILYYETYFANNTKVTKVSNNLHLISIIVFLANMFAFGVSAVWQQLPPLL